MNDKRILEGCPFCGTPNNLIQIYINKREVKYQGKKQGQYTEVYCPNPDCEAKIQGYGVMNIINRWNRRWH